MRTTTIGGGSQIAGWQRDNFCTPRFSRRGVRPDLEHRPTVSSNVFSGPGAIAVGESDNRFSVVVHLPLPGDGSLLPEKRLMLAVLNDALLTLARHRGAADYRAQKRVSEVDVWVASDDVEWPFAFVNVCDALHLDASRVRSRLEDARRRMLRVPARGGMDPLGPGRSTRSIAAQCGPTSTQPQVSQRRSYDEVCLVLDDEERKRQLDGLASIAEARAFDADGKRRVASTNRGSEDRSSGGALRRTGVRVGGRKR